MYWGESLLILFYFFGLISSNAVFLILPDFVGIEMEGKYGTYGLFRSFSSVPYSLFGSSMRTTIIHVKLISINYFPWGI
jgi:hypothetical protein